MFSNLAQIRETSLQNSVFSFGGGVLQQLQGCLRKVQGYPRVQSMRVTDWRLERGAETNVAFFKEDSRGFFGRSRPVRCFRGALLAVVVDVSRGGCEG